MGRFEIIFADEMGFCFGVRRALEIIHEAADGGARVASLGDIIHNPQEVQKLQAKGVDVLDELDEAVNRKELGRLNTLAITAHGAAPHVAGGARAAGLQVIDTTCPLVTLVHTQAARLRDQGYYIIVFGDRKHPEVRGIMGHAGEKRVRDNALRGTALAGTARRLRRATHCQAAEEGRDPLADDDGHSRVHRVR